MDIRIVWDVANARGDWSLLNGDLDTSDDLATAVLVSLFTDRLAHADDAIPDGTTDRRGWWGDDATDLIGSRLWLLDRAKQTQDTLNRARDYITEALQWLIDDGAAARIDVLTEWSRPGMLGSLITIYRTDGTSVPLNYAWAWQGISNAV